MDPALGHLTGAEDRRALPVIFLDPVQGGAHQVRLLEFEEELRASESRFMPAHDRVMAEAQITRIEFDPAIPEPPLGICHRFMPLTRAHRVAGAEPIDRAQPGLRNDGEQRMKTAATLRRGCS